MRKYDGAILVYALKYALCDSTHAVVKFTEMVKEYLDCLSYADLLLFGRLCEQAAPGKTTTPNSESTPIRKKKSTSNTDTLSPTPPKREMEHGKQTTAKKRIRHRQIRKPCSSGKSGCKGCNDRHIGCHSSCEAYRAFCQRNAAIKAKRRAETADPKMFVIQTKWLKRCLRLRKWKG